jgi:hypothetical protein
MDRLGGEEIDGLGMDRDGADTDGRSIERDGAEIVGRSTDRDGAEIVGRSMDRDGAEMDGRSTDRGAETVGRSIVRDEVLGELIRGAGGVTRVDGAVCGTLTLGALSREGRVREIEGALVRADGVETRGDGADSCGAIVRFCGVDAMRGDSVRDGVVIRGDGSVRSFGACVRESPCCGDAGSVRFGVVNPATLRFESGRSGACVRVGVRDGRLIEPRVDRSRAGVRAIGAD